MSTRTTRYDVCSYRFHPDRSPRRTFYGRFRGARCTTRKPVRSVRTMLGHSSSGRDGDALPLIVSEVAVGDAACACIGQTTTYRAGEAARRSEVSKRARERRACGAARAAFGHALRHAGVTAFAGRGATFSASPSRVVARGPSASRTERGFPRKPSGTSRSSAIAVCQVPSCSATGVSSGSSVMVPSVEHGIFALDIEGGLDVGRRRYHRPRARPSPSCQRRERRPGVAGGRAELPSHSPWTRNQRGAELERRTLDACRVRCRLWQGHGFSSSRLTSSRPTATIPGRSATS